MMPDAVSWECLEKVRSELSSLADADGFAPASGQLVQKLRSTAIVIRKLAKKTEDYNEVYGNEVVPGIILSYAGSVTSPTQGVNCRDDTVHMIVAQLLVNDSERDARYLRTHLAWSQNIRRVINNRTAMQFSQDDADVYIANVIDMDQMDEMAWMSHQKMIRTVVARFKSREQRVVI